MRTLILGLLISFTLTFLPAQGLVSAQSESTSTNITSQIGLFKLSLTDPGDRYERRPPHVPIAFGLYWHTLLRTGAFLVIDAHSGWSLENRPDGEWLRWIHSNDYPPPNETRPPQTVTYFNIDCQSGLLIPLTNTVAPIMVGGLVGIRWYKESWDHDTWFPRPDYPDPPPNGHSKMQLTVEARLAVPLSNLEKANRLGSSILTIGYIFSPLDLVKDSRTPITSADGLRWGLLIPLNGSSLHTQKRVRSDDQVDNEYKRPLRFGWILGTAAYNASVSDIWIGHMHIGCFAQIQLPRGWSILGEVLKSTYGEDRLGFKEGRGAYPDIDDYYSYWRGFPVRPAGRFWEIKTGISTPPMGAGPLAFQLGALAGIRRYEEWWHFLKYSRDIPLVPQPYNPEIELMGLSDFRVIIKLEKLWRNAEIHVGRTYDMGLIKPGRSRRIVDVSGDRLSLVLKF